MRRVGRLSYMMLLPLLRHYLSRTRRAYVLLESGGEVLVVKSWLGRGLWQLPGGGVKKNETPVSAAIRELAEETGVRIDSQNLKEIVSGVWRTDRLGFNYTIFFGRLDTRPSIKLLRPELSAGVWIDPAKLGANDTAAEVLAAIRSITL